MIVNHPKVARVSCDECKRLWFDPEKGEFVERAGKVLPRPEGPLPCNKCPKKSPEREHEFTLTEDNAEIVALFYKMDARNWQGLTPACVDEVNAGMLMIVKQVVESGRQKQNAELLAAKLAPLLITGSVAK